MAGLSIYQNMKADNIDHYGFLMVEHCEHIGPWDFNYRCYGSWQQGSGLVIQPTAVVDVTGLYKRGDTIPDIYPASTSNAAAISTNGPIDKVVTFVSGAERRGWLHNLPATVIIVMALEALLITPLIAVKMYYTSRRSVANK